MHSDPALSRRACRAGSVVVVVLVGFYVNVGAADVIIVIIIQSCIVGQHGVGVFIRICVQIDIVFQRIIAGLGLGFGDDFHRAAHAGQFYGLFSTAFGADRRILV